MTNYTTVIQLRPSHLTTERPVPMRVHGAHLDPAAPAERTGEQLTIFDALEATA